MMLITMGLDKSQVPDEQTYTQNGTFNRDLAIMAGYTDFDVLVVGAGGGASGKANGRTTDNKANALYPSGGGGGGALRRMASLLSLPSSKMSVAVGKAGTDGANSGNGVKAGNGTTGGSSSFNSWVAYGGKGGVGGMLRVGLAGSINEIQVQYGGDGGVTSVGGIPGEGQRGHSQQGGGTGSNPQAVGPIIAAGGLNDGVWDAPQTGPGQGGGGGGGVGSFMHNGSWADRAYSGARGSTPGNSTVGNYGAPGSSPSGENGGGAGGANIQPLDGVANRFGMGRPNSLGSTNGVVILKLS